MLSFFIGLLKFLVVIDCLLLILIVLMQRPRQEGLGAAFGSGVMDQLAGAQTTNVLQKVTTWLGILLFLFTFVLAILVAKSDNRTGGPSLVTEADKKAAATAPATPPAASPATSATPAAPKADEAKPAEAKPAAPAPAPATPKVEAKPVTPAPTAPKVEAKPATPEPAKPTPAPAPVPATPPAAPTSTQPK